MKIRFLGGNRTADLPGMLSHKEVSEEVSCMQLK